MSFEIKKRIKENYHKYHVQSMPHHCTLKRNAVFISVANSLKHELKKLEICYELKKTGCQFITEAVRNKKENGKDRRVDIVDLNTGREIEIETSKKVKKAGAITIYLEKNEDFLKQVCHDCGAKEGELHKLGCDMERCPICGLQAITCYEHCVEAETGKFDEKFKTFKRVPYLIFLVYCVKCLKLNPKFFNVSDEEWKRVIPIKFRRFVFCKDCYDKIKKWMK